MVKLFFGKRGAGKTTAINGLLLSEQQPIFIFDLLGNYSHCGKVFDSAKEAIAHFVWRQETGMKHKPLVIQSQNIEEDIDLLCEALWRNQGGTLILDEVDSINYAKAKRFDFVIRYGRNRNIDIVAGCRRPAELSKHITASADIFYCFTTHEPRDVEYFRTLFGDEAFDLPKLKRFHGLYIDYKTNSRGRFKTEASGKIIRYDKSRIYSE